jgi:hypothetical protein
MLQTVGLKNPTTTRKMIYNNNYNFLWCKLIISIVTKNMFSFFSGYLK